MSSLSSTTRMFFVMATTSVISRLNCEHINVGYFKFISRVSQKDHNSTTSSSIVILSKCLSNMLKFNLSIDIPVLTWRIRGYAATFSLCLVAALGRRLPYPDMPVCGSVHAENGRLLAVLGTIHNSYISIRCRTGRDPTLPFPKFLGTVKMYGNYSSFSSS